MNEILRRAILSAGLDEIDVAARLEVDPKTVRRWLEGRVPYSRHRWALADLLRLDETALWPELRPNQPRPDELLAVYPHRSSITRQMWRNLFASAKHEISILDYSSLFLVDAPEIRSILTEKAHRDVRVRIALGDQDASKENNDSLATESRDSLTPYEALHQVVGIEIRQHRIVLYNSIYRADDNILVVQHMYGVSFTSWPVLHLRCEPNSDMGSIYLNEFNQIWNTARDLNLEVIKLDRSGHVSRCAASGSLNPIPIED